MAEEVPVKKEPMPSGSNESLIKITLSRIQTYYIYVSYARTRKYNN